jgi:hypothetical protein
MHELTLLIEIALALVAAFIPKSMMIYEAGDRIGLIGDKSQIEAVEQLVDMEVT